MLVSILRKIRPTAKWKMDEDKLVWLDKDQTEPTPTEIEEGRLLVEADIAKADLKKNGEDYQGYQIPFMNEDAIALMQVKSAFEMGVTSTNIEFSNGTIMPMTPADFQEFAVWFVNKRNEFFL